MGGFGGWITGFGLAPDDQDPDDDPDGDGVSNLYEYGLNGNPNDILDAGTSPTLAAVPGGGPHGVVYVHPQRSEANSGLVYYLELTDDLVQASWTNGGYIATGTNVTGGDEPGGRPGELLRPVHGVGRQFRPVDAVPRRQRVERQHPGGLYLRPRRHAFLPQLGEEGNPEEESAHIPLFMRMPGTVPSGQVSDTVIGGVDVMPTLLSLCGLPPQKTCTGVDKSDAAQGLPMPQIDSIFCPHQGKWRMVPTDRYKLIVKDNTSPMTINSVTELFDMDNDPYELVNLKDDPGHAAIKQQLYERLVQWIAETGDSWPAEPARAKDMYTT